MQIILLGPPGSGKGTQARLLSEKLKIPHISTGDILREAIKDKVDLGKRAQKFLEKGELVPDKIILGIIQRRLRQSDCRNGFLLDGFPRTIAQAKGLNRILEKMKRDIDSVIKLNVSDKLVTRRLLNRLTCVRCDANFNLDSNPSKIKKRCDLCGGKLEHRTDDTEEVIRKRLRVYYQQTESLRDHYEKQGKLVVVNGEGKVEQTAKGIVKILKRQKVRSFE